MDLTADRGNAGREGRRTNQIARHCRQELASLPHKRHRFPLLRRWSYTASEISEIQHHPQQGNSKARQTGGKERDKDTKA